MFHCSAGENLKGCLKRLLKVTYDLSKKEETTPSSSALPELIVEGFDVEQIWQQLELQNSEFLDNAVTSVSRVVAAKDKLISSAENEETDKDSESGGDAEEIASKVAGEEDEASDSESELEQPSSQKQKKAKKKSALGLCAFICDFIISFASTSR